MKLKLVKFGPSLQNNLVDKNENITASKGLIIDHEINCIS
jgi:hypothetical protein